MFRMSVDCNGWLDCRFGTTCILLGACTHVLYPLPRVSVPFETSQQPPIPHTHAHTYKTLHIYIYTCMHKHIHIDRHTCACRGNSCGLTNGVLHRYDKASSSCIISSLKIVEVVYTLSQFSTFALYFSCACIVSPYCIHN